MKYMQFKVYMQYTQITLCVNPPARIARPLRYDPRREG